METLNLKQAAEFLNIHPETLRQGAKAGEIPGAKIGKSWVCIKEDLLNHIRARYAPKRQVAQVHIEEKKLCHLNVAEVSGGSTSSIPTDEEYAAALKL